LLVVCHRHVNCVRCCAVALRAGIGSQHAKDYASSSAIAHKLGNIAHHNQSLLHTRGCKLAQHTEKGTCCCSVATLVIHSALLLLKLHCRKPLAPRHTPAPAFMLLLLLLLFLLLAAHLASRHTLGQGVHVVTVGGAHIVIWAQRPDHSCNTHHQHTAGYARKLNRQQQCSYSSVPCQNTKSCRMIPCAMNPTRHEQQLSDHRTARIVAGFKHSCK
jgi:hypothetical protein